MLVEEAIHHKYAFAFLARNEAANNRMNDEINKGTWSGRNGQVSLYKNNERRGPYEPSKTSDGKPRPASSSMRKFGISKWVDEAVQVPPAYRDDVLNTLKDLTVIDKYLLGSEATAECIDELQAATPAVTRVRAPVTHEFPPFALTSTSSTSY